MRIISRTYKVSWAFKSSQGEGRLPWRAKNHAPPVRGPSRGPPGLRMRRTGIGLTEHQEGQHMISREIQLRIYELRVSGAGPDEVYAAVQKEFRMKMSRKTFNKYYAQDTVPDNPGAKLAKKKSFDEEPFRTRIITIMERNSSNTKLCYSSIYDFMYELFVDSGMYERLPGNEQTLRNYCKYLVSSNTVTMEPGSKRIYDGVFETAPGEQMQIDFGQISCQEGLIVHFICMLLHFSRYLVVICQDHKFNSVDACRAIYRCFCRIGGRVRHLVIDQDSVFVQSEQYGEVIETEVFGDFLREQELDLRVCRKNDPETKGCIENSVKFVKSSFFSSRIPFIVTIDDVYTPIAMWQDRQNKRIHKKTFCIPAVMFEQYEKEALRPLVPSFYETSLSSYTSTDVGSRNYITYKSNTYSVPTSCCDHTVFYKAVKGKLHIYDERHDYVCSHVIAETKGGTYTLDEHRHPEQTKWYDVAERMRAKWSCGEFQHFVNGVKKENSREVNCQLDNQFIMIEKIFEKLNPTREQAEAAINYACNNYRYRYSQFKPVLEMAIAGTLPDRNKAAELKQRKEAAMKDLDLQPGNFEAYQRFFDSNAGASPEEDPARS